MNREGVKYDEISVIVTYRVQALLLLLRLVVAVNQENQLRMNPLHADRMVNVEKLKKMIHKL